jgi:hypothetical protein
VKKEKKEKKARIEKCTALLLAPSPAWPSAASERAALRFVSLPSSHARSPLSTAQAKEGSASDAEKKAKKEKARRWRLHHSSSSLTLSRSLLSVSRKRRRRVAAPAPSLLPPPPHLAQSAAPLDSL